MSRDYSKDEGLCVTLERQVNWKEPPGAHMSATWSQAATAVFFASAASATSSPRTCFFSAVSPSTSAWSARAEITADLVAAAEGLMANKPDGARAIIAGCTEIPLALSQQDLSVPYFDSLTILARAAILRAGVTPVALA